MLKRVVETFVCGAIGAVSLYIVGKIAYQAGKEIGREETKYAMLVASEHQVSDANEQKTKETGESNADVTIYDSKPLTKKSCFQSIFNRGKNLLSNGSVLGRLIRNPESHKIEAFVEGEEIKINIKRNGESRNKHTIL